MNKLVKDLFLFCVFITTTNHTFSEGEVFQMQTSQPEVHHAVTDLSLKKSLESKEVEEGRNIMNAGESSANFEKQSKPMRSIFLGIYKNYKSTYLGNKTLTEYKQTLRENMKKKQQHQHQLLQNENVDDNDGMVTEYTATNNEAHIETTTTITVTPIEKKETKSTLSPNSKKRKNTVITDATVKRNITKLELNVQQYNVGPALNLSLDMANNIVKVNLDGESLKEMVTGHWLNDNTEEGRGKKYEMVTRILPLFILPFLIQSAIVPFLVTKLKLLLVKSLLVGKLAIFLLIVSAFRNSNKQMQSYEVAPSYWASEPSRRSELATVASNVAYNGYRVEGKPAAWIN